MKLMADLKQAFVDGAHDTLRAARRDWKEVKKGAREVAYGVGDAAEGFVVFPEVALQYITGTSSQLGERTSWSHFGSQYQARDDYGDNPLTRTADVANHMVYGSLDLLSGHLLYSGAKALGVEQYTPFFSPPPTTLRGVASDLTNVVFLAVMPEAARVAKAKMGIPPRTLPASGGTVFKELAELSERSRYAAEMARGQARLAAMQAEMAAAAQDGVAFNQWAKNGERGAIIMSKPKSINWVVLAKTYPVDPFLDAVQRRFAYLKSEVVRQVDIGRTGPQIMVWFNAKVLPELYVLLEAIREKMKMGNDEGLKLHNFRNRISNFYGLLPLFLEENSLGEVRILCAPPGSSLTSVATLLATKYETIARVETKGLSGVCFSPHVDLDLMMQVLENLIQNAAEHRKPDQPAAHVQISFTGTELLVLDKGLGMCEAQLARVNAGIRSHDGKPVIEDTIETLGHGYGVQTVHQLAAEQGVQVVYSSVEGSHTSAALIAKVPGIFAPDPMTYIFTDEASMGHLEVMTQRLSSSQRMQLVKELSKLSVDIVDAFFSKYMELVETRQDPTPAVDIARRLLKRYVPYLEMLVGEDPVVMSSPEALTCTKIIKSMCFMIDHNSIPNRK